MLVNACIGASGVAFIPVPDSLVSARRRDELAGAVRAAVCACKRVGHRLLRLSWAHHGGRLGPLRRHQNNRPRAPQAVPRGRRPAVRTSGFQPTGLPLSDEAVNQRGRRVQR